MRHAIGRGAADSLDAWTDYVYLRDNPRGPHREYWQHVHGCREWVIVARDTLSHEVSSGDPGTHPTGEGK